MCIACHYPGDGRLVTREHRASAHDDGDYRCVRLDSGQPVCVDCGAPANQAADVVELRGRLVVDHLCASVWAIQKVGTHYTRFADRLRTDVACSSGEQRALGRVPHHIHAGRG